VLLLLLAGGVLRAQGDADLYRRQALEHARKAEWNEAIADYRRAVELEPGDPLTHYNLGLALKYQGQPGPAAEEFQKVLRAKPAWPDAHFALGAAYYDLQDRTISSA
jgi:tetratricopeptide (TPR) repeat protein